LAGFGFWYAVVYFLIVPTRAGLTYRRQKALQRPYDVGWNANGVAIDNEFSNGVTPWSDYRKWRESKGLFLLYLSDRLFHLLPKRAFANEDAVATFRGVLRERIAARPGRVRKTK
jgi:hypothetical protein